MKRNKNKAAKGSYKDNHLDNVSQLSPSCQTTEQDSFTEYSSEDNTKSVEDSEGNVLAEENVTTEENMDIRGG